MTSFRVNHTATLLQNGKVLVVGGDREGNATPAAELFDPTTGSWTNTGPMTVPRTHHSATLLPNGKVLVAGGDNFNSFLGLTSAELYDPATGTWTGTASLNTNHDSHTATLLLDGRVLVAGDWNNGQPLPNAEVYDPESGTWTLTSPMNWRRALHTATLLADGKVLLVGGRDWSDNYTASTDVYDPSTGTWTAGPSLNIGRDDHTTTLLPNGNVLVTGGASFGAYLSSVEVYDPTAEAWTVFTNLMTMARAGHTATLQPNGTVLLFGGLLNGSTLRTAEVYDPATGTCTAPISANAASWLQSATLLPSGKILVTGGVDTLAQRTAQVYDPGDGNWVTTGALHTGRSSHSATILPDGKVLVTGGGGSNNAFYTSSELFDATTGAWTLTGSLTNSRTDYTATLLSNGQVLVAGGFGNSARFAGAELYDPLSGQWTPTGSLNAGRWSHTATWLPSGKVLVTGGSSDGVSALTSAELYDSATGTWSFTGPLTTNRQCHTATLLPSGKVLVAAGYNNVGGFHALATCELYDPGSGQWTTTGALTNAHGDHHTATLLPNGKVLLAGGYNSSNGYLASAELYDPVTGTWASTGALHIGRNRHTATLLPNGKVLVAGGTGFAGVLASVEVYDPLTGNWTQLDPMTTNRYVHTATLLANGNVLITGGTSDGVNPLAAAELYDCGLGFSAAWRPQISAFNSPLISAGSLNLTGALFRGVAHAGGGAQGAPADYPLVQLRSVDSGQTLWLTCTNWSTNRFVSGPLPAFPPGQAWVTVYANGIPSTSALLTKIRAAASVTLSNLSQTYDSTPRTVTASTLPAGRTVYFTYNGSFTAPTNAGTYTVVGTVNDMDYAGSATSTLVVGSATATLTLGSLSQTYTGTARKATATTTPPGLTVTFTYNGSSAAPTNVGSYTVVGTINDPNAFYASATNTLTITPATAGLTLDNLNQTYNGSARVVTATTSPLGLQVTLTYNGSPSAPTNAGIYMVTATVVDPNYQGTKTGTLVVAKAAGTVTLANLNQVYDGTLRFVTATTTPPGLSVNMTYNYQPYAPVEAGSYTVRGTINDLNYQGSATNTLLVSPAPATVTLGNLRQIYDGQPKPVTVTTVPAGLAVNVTYNGSTSAPVNAGSYTVLGTVSARNYQGSATNPLAIYPPIILVPALFTNATFGFWFTNTPGAAFSVLATPNSALPLSNWLPLGNVTEVSPGQFTFTDLQATNFPQRFYRVRSP
jgi:hypothetical protein